MDGSQFDTLLRIVTTTRSRRGAILSVLGGVAGLIDLGASEAKHKKHKHKKGGSPPGSPPPGKRCPASCPDCQQCVNGQSCTPKTDGTACGNNDCKTCQSGSCVNKVDNTVCNDGAGLCGSGTCNTPPPCSPYGTQCAGPGTVTPFPCCGAAEQRSCLPINQLISQCLGLGAAGDPCRVPQDCLSLQCAGFHCW